MRQPRHGGRVGLAFRPVLTLFHDLTSPASAVAVMRLGRLAAAGLAVTFEGFEAVGLDVALPPDLAVLAQLEELSGPALAEGLRLRRPTAMPSTGSAHVLLAHAECTPAARSVREGLYRAYWENDADIADLGVLERVATTAGLDAREVRRLLADRVALAARRRRMAALRREGVGGVPVILANRTLVPGLLAEADLWTMAATA